MQISAQAITVIILMTVIGSFLIGIIADLLNLKNLKDILPLEFKGYYDDSEYIKSQQYLKTNTFFGTITQSIDLLAMLVFWFVGGFNYIDIFARSFGFTPIVTGLVFIGTLAGLKFLLSIPFNLYATFVIEEKFGFNKTTVATFLTDLLKTTLLSLLLGSIIFSAIFWFLYKTGTWAWLLCWIFATVFVFLVQYIVPTFIMPLFNKFTPLEDGPLKEAIFDYAASINFPLTQIFVMDGSKRSTKSNAFFTGFGRNKRIVLFDTLIKEQSIEELVAILAHEMGHYKKRHILKRLVMAVIQMGIMFYLLSICISSQGLFDAFFMDQQSIWAGLVFFGMLYSPVEFILSIFLQYSSRKDEYEADRFAADTLDNPIPLITALKKLSVHNLSNLQPHPFYVVLNYSHPPVLERIESLKS